MYIQVYTGILSCLWCDLSYRDYEKWTKTAVTGVEVFWNFLFHRCANCEDRTVVNNVNRILNYSLEEVRVRDLVLKWS